MRVPETLPNALGRGSRFAAMRGFASGDLPPPSPPGEKATAREDQAGQSCTGDGGWDEADRNPSDRNAVERQPRLKGYVECNRYEVGDAKRDLIGTSATDSVS